MDTGVSTLLPSSTSSMSPVISKLLPWILAFLHCCHLAVTLKCGTCEYGSNFLECPNYYERQFEVKITEDIKNNVEYMVITCNHQPEVNYTLLNGCSFPDVVAVKFSLCPLTNESIADTFSKIGVDIDKIEELTIYHPFQTVDTLSSDLLAGLNNLTFLNIESTFKDVEENAFSDTPNLQTLYFRGNDLGTLHKDTFKPLTNLSTLNLNHNKLTSVPAGLLDSLRELKSLSLWKNSIDTLPPKFFDNLIHLENLTLASNNFTTLDDLFVKNANLSNVNFKKNNIEYLSEGLFRNCSKLRTLKLSQNKIEILPDEFFASCTNLEEIEFNKNKLTSLNESVFSNLTSVVKIDFSTNNLRTLPALIFDSLTSLKELDLSNNALESLPKELFHKTINLNTLSLKNNSLESLPDTLFLNTISLEAIDLSKNRLTELAFNTFHSSSSPSIKEINLSYNNLTSEGIMVNYVFALNTQLKLEMIDLSYNQFVGFPAQANLFNFLQLKVLNFEGNLFRGMILDDLLELADNIEVNLKFNKIETVIIDRKNVDKTISVHLEGNNFTCNCQLFDLINIVKHDDSTFLRYSYLTVPVKPKEYSTATIYVVDKEKLYCQRPSYLSKQTLLDVDLFKLTCTLSASECSADCPCHYRNLDNTIVVDCVNRNLEEVPNVIYYSKYNYTLDLTGNSISSFNLSHPSITNLTLADNSFTSENINSNTTILPPNLRHLDLRGNNLTYLIQDFMDNINQTGTNVELMENPWICNCDIKPLHIFVQENHLRVRHLRRVTCEDKDNAPLVDLKEEDVCPFYLDPMVATTIAIVVILMVLFTVMGTGYFYKYKTRIKVWLFTHRVCLWLVAEDELDVDKQYDAFISYSHKDEEFVSNTLVPELENGDPKYRLCLHYRDWVAGEFIQNQIMESVHNSRRTLVVLSKNFIESVWGQMEFRAAHQQALEDKTNRVIVIVYGEMPPEEALDEELRHYVKLHTYLKWGNPRFWENLRYAMPHPRQFLKKKKKVRTDKLELVNGHAMKDNAISV